MSIPRNFITVSMDRSGIATIITPTAVVIIPFIKIRVEFDELNKNITVSFYKDK